MKLFELSKKTYKGKRKFKLVLCKIFPDSCVDEANQVGTDYNENGITWLKEYCEKACPTIQDESLRCEFVDEERIEILGHGETGIVDGVPTFEDATVIGHFTKAYIDEIEDEDGEKITVCIGEGYIDARCYHNFVTKLDEDIAEGIYPFGSVEIERTDDNEGIIYKYGWKEFGRIPTEFKFSGYALLGIRPADQSAKLVELNNKHKEEKQIMDIAEVKAIVAETVAEMNSKQAELDAVKADCEAKVSEANSQLETAVSEKNEAVASVEKIQQALDEAKEELDAKCKEIDEKYEELSQLHAEIDSLRKQLGDAKAEKRLGELNEAISKYTDEEKAYAKEEIEAFKANPVEGEINSVTDKILAGIGKAYKESEAARIAEQNSKKEEADDIYGYVDAIVDGEADDIYAAR